MAAADSVADDPVLSAAAVLASGVTECDTLWCLDLLDRRQVPADCATVLAWPTMNAVSLLLPAAGELDPAGPVCAPVDVDGLGDPVGEAEGDGGGDGEVVADDEGDGGLDDAGGLEVFAEALGQGVEVLLGPGLAEPLEGEPVP